MEKVDQDQIINQGLICPSKPFCPLDHVGPETIIKEEVQEHIPLPLILVDWSISGVDHTKEAILGYLPLLSVIFTKQDMTGNKPHKWTGNDQTQTLGYALYCPSE